MCDGLWDQVNSPTCLVPQLAKHSSMGSIKRDPIPLFQRSGSIVKGPKNPTLPQLVAKLEPTSLPSTSAPKAASGAANQRVRTKLASPMNVIGSGSPRKVPNARRMMRSASERSPSLNGRTETSGFTSTIVSSFPTPNPTSIKLGKTKVWVGWAPCVYALPGANQASGPHLCLVSSLANLAPKPPSPSRSPFPQDKTGHCGPIGPLSSRLHHWLPPSHRCPTFRTKFIASTYPY